MPMRTFWICLTILLVIETFGTFVVNLQYTTTSGLNGVTITLLFEGVMLWALLTRKTLITQICIVVLFVLSALSIILDGFAVPIYLDMLYILVLFSTFVTFYRRPGRPS